MRTLTTIFTVLMLFAVSFSAVAVQAQSLIEQLRREPPVQGLEWICTSRDNDGLSPYAFAIENKNTFELQISNAVFGTMEKCTAALSQPIEILDGEKFFCGSRDDDGLEPFTAFRWNVENRRLINFDKLLLINTSDQGCMDSLVNVSVRDGIAYVCASRDKDGLSPYSVFQISENPDPVGRTHESLEDCINALSSQITEVVGGSPAVAIVGDDQLGPSDSIDIAKTTCGDLGFTPGTEKFGECVLKLIEAGVISPSPAQSPVAVAPSPTPQSGGLSPIVVTPGTRADPIVRAVVAVIEPLLAEIDAVLGVGSPVLVEDDDISVHVTLPALQISGPSGHLSFGDVEFVVTPRVDGLYDFDFSISQAIEAFAFGSKLAEIYPGNLQIVGTWSVPLQTFTSLQVDINDAWINGGRVADSRLAEIGSLVIQRDMGPSTGGMWNGTFDFALSDVRVFSEDNAALEIGSYTIKNTWDGVDVVGLAELRKKLGLVLPWFGADLEEEVLWDYLEAGISLEWGRGNWTSSITDFLFREEGQEYHLGEAGLRFGYDLTEDLGEVSVGLTVGELALELADIPRELVPHRLSLDIALTKLPLKALLSKIVLEGPNSFGDFDPGRPELVFRNFEVNSDVLEIVATGAIALTNDSSSPMNEFPVLGLVPPLSATLDIAIVGLSEAIQSVGANMPNIPDGEAALVALVVLRGVGHPQFDLAQRGIVHQYRVVVSPDGGISVNGVPIDQLWR